VTGCGAESAPSVPGLTELGLPAVCPPITLGPRVCGLAAGGSWIRTLGPP
jgi:hypothetical protein